MKPRQLDDQLLDLLVRSKGERLISVAIPTHISGREVSHDRLQLKNKLAEIESELEENGVRRRDRSTQLEGARALLDDLEFWEHQSEQLALYINDGGEFFPIAVSRQAEHLPLTVTSVFYLRHVLSELNPVQVHVLVLTQNAVKLYETNSRGLVETEADLPSSFDDVNWFVDRETQRQQHPDRGGSPANRHGHDPMAKRGEDIARFLRAVRDALPNQSKSKPLVVLGDDNLVHRFENVYHHPILSPENSGLDVLSDSTVYEKVVPEVERHRTMLVEESAAAALDQLGEGNATADLVEALRDAVAGRLARLVLYRDSDPVWGRFEPESLEIESHEEQSSGDVDLLDRLVAKAHETGAEIVPSSGRIGGHDLVATRRF